MLGTAWENRRPPDKKEEGRSKKREEGGLAQLGEHLPCKQGVESSNLLVSMIAVGSAERDGSNCLCWQREQLLLFLFVARAALR